MSKKRIFDIEFPEEPVMSEPAVDNARRGPMATAISENADALRERAETERAIRSENDRLAHEHVRMRREGLLTDLIPLDEIRTDKLSRDRKGHRDEEIDDLKTSILSVGLSNPIRVEVIDGGYELIQGYRRLTAYREIYSETGNVAYSRIPAGLVAEGAALELLYRRMVDENLVRRDISFAEMALLANGYAQDERTPVSTVSDAVASLYGSAGRQKRNYILHFASLLDRIGEVLCWPELIPRALGLDLEKRLSEDASQMSKLIEMLRHRAPATGEEELQILRSFLDDIPPAKRPDAFRKPRTGAKTTLRIAGPEGHVKCTAADGRLELRGDADFSAVDRHRLEEALREFLQAIRTV